MEGRRGRRRGEELQGGGWRGFEWFKRAARRGPKRAHPWSAGHVELVLDEVVVLHVVVPRPVTARKGQSTRSGCFKG